MTQVPAAQAPAAPTAVPAVPGATVVTPRELNGVPATAQDVAALQARRSVLSDQLVSATGRRHDVARQLRSATGADKLGLEQRMSVLDVRIARLESDIDQTGQQLASAPVALIAQRQDDGGFGGNPTSNNRLMSNLVPILIVFTIFVLCPIALSYARSIWKRGSVQRPSAADAESARRLERMEQSMDAIAIEIERVSEGQRFVTRILAEGRGEPALAAGQAPMEPVHVKAAESARL